MDLIIQTKCNNCGAITASQEVTRTNPEARDRRWEDGLPFTLAPCCDGNHTNPCVTLVVITRDEWLKATGGDEPAVYNGTIVQAAKDLLDYTSDSVQQPFYRRRKGRS